MHAFSVSAQAFHPLLPVLVVLFACRIRLLESGKKSQAFVGSHAAKVGKGDGSTRIKYLGNFSATKPCSWREFAAITSLKTRKTDDING